MPGYYYRFEVFGFENVSVVNGEYRPSVPVTAYSTTSAIVAVGAVPGTPVISGLTFSGSTVTLGWTVPSAGDFPISGYTVEVSSDNGVTWIPGTTAAAGATSASVSGLTLGQAYKLRVRANNPAGPGTFAVSAAVTPLDVPGKPTNLSFISLTSSIYVTWSAPASNGGTPITDYVVQYSDNDGATWTTAPHAVSTTPELLVSGLTNAVHYGFRVSAINAFGTGPYSDTAPTIAPSPDTAWLMDYVRQLTGVFSKDIVTDELLLFWMNEAYVELSRAYEWPWLPIVPLSLTNRPGFDQDFFTILCYRVASRVLTLEADDSNRSAAYNGEYEAMLANMYKHYLRAQDAGNPTDMAGLILFIRTLLDEYSQTLDDAFIQNKILNTHEELAASESWVFPSSTFPYMGWDQARVLAYGAAARLAPFVGKDQAFVNVLLEEYMSSVSHLRILFQNNFSGRNYSAEALARQARDFLGNYSTKASDSILKLWVYEEYQNICSERSWAWLEKTAEVTVPAGSTEFSLLSDLTKIYEIHRVVTRTQHATTGVVDTEPVVLVPGVLDVRQNDPRLYYVVNHTAGKIQIAPVQTEDTYLRIRYAVTPEDGYLMPATIAGSTGDNFTEFAIPSRYLHILSYRVAMRAAVLSEAPQDVYNMCSKAAQDLYDSMYRDYETAHTQEPFQLGGNALETRKYVPWFRTA